MPTISCEQFPTKNQSIMKWIFVMDFLFKSSDCIYSVEINKNEKKLIISQRFQKFCLSQMPDCVECDRNLHTRKSAVMAPIPFSFQIGLASYRIGLLFTGGLL